MDTRLLEAALVGDVDSLLRLLDEDAHILDIADGVVAETPLHIASLFGHVEFAKATLSRKPVLASVLDSHQSSPLHLASAKGHVEVVKKLLKSDPGMCFARDKDGMTPLHAAALKGRVDVVKELVGAKRIVTRVLTNQREPILHFCVNHDRFEIVKTLLECAGDDEDFVKMKDDDDNTILHLSVAKSHNLLTKFLVENTRMRAEVNALNANGLTALDIFLRTYSDEPLKEVMLERILKCAGAKKAIPPSEDSWMVRLASKDRRVNWLDKNKTRSALMVVAILIATVTFQLGVSPPGGFWQDDDKDKHHIAGQSIMAQKHRQAYDWLSRFNSTGFISSLCIILVLLLIPPESFFNSILLRGFTILAVSSMAASYLLARIFIRTEAGYNWLIGRSIADLFISCLIFICVSFYLYTGFITKSCYWIARTMTLRKVPPPPPPLMDATYVDVEVESRSNTTN